MLLDKASERVTALSAANDPVSQYVMGSVAQKLGAVRKPVVFTPEVAESRVRGEAIYAKVCTACHQPNGKGLAPDFPPLAGSEWVAGKPEAMVLPIIHGLAGEIQVAGVKFNGIMPPNPTFSDADVADVATFIRTSFGNSAPAITADQVKAIRASHAARKDMWKAAELMEFLPKE
jgi:mono/diheme cytochrome c family protein